MSTKKKNNVNKVTGAIQAPETKSGQFVLDNQVLAKEDGFSRVNKSWFDKTKDWAWTRNEVGIYKGQTEDIDVTFDVGMVPSKSDDGSFVFVREENNREYHPTPRALLTLATRIGGFYTTAQDILGVEVDPDDDQVYKMSHKSYDADTFTRYLRGKVSEKELGHFNWRLNNATGEVRAVFTSHKDRGKKKGAPFTAIDNLWLIDILSDLIPDGRMSHWRGNPDTIRGNVLVPDSIMTNNGQDYGGGIAIRNSEIGECRVCVMPFLFVAICFNGNIWDRVDGENVIKTHRGKVDLNALREQIHKSVTMQLQLIPTSIERFLNTRTFAWDGCSEMPIFTELGNKFRFTPQQVRRSFEAYGVERRENVENERTLMGLINAVTRAAQGYDDWKGFRGSSYDNMGRAAGEMINWQEKQFDNLISRANSLDERDVAKYFGALATN